MTTQSAPRSIEYRRLSDVRPALRNPRDHDLDLVRASIRRFGFVDGAVHDGRTDRIIAGHGRTEGLSAMEADGETAPEGIVVDDDGAWLMPVQVGWSSRSDEDAEALLVVLNKATERASWRRGELDQILIDLHGVDPSLLDVTGFTVDDVAALREEPVPNFDEVDDGTRLDQKNPTTCPSCSFTWRVGARGEVQPC